MNRLRKPIKALKTQPIDLVLRTTLLFVQGINAWYRWHRRLGMSLIKIAFIRGAR